MRPHRRPLSRSSSCGARGGSAVPASCRRAPAPCTPPAASCAGRSPAAARGEHERPGVSAARPMLDQHQRGAAREGEGRHALLGLQRHTPTASVDLMPEGDRGRVEVTQVEVLPPRREQLRLGSGRHVGQCVASGARVSHRSFCPVPADIASIAICVTLSSFEPVAAPAVHG